jgi:hypothetical protein
VPTSIPPAPEDELDDADDDDDEEFDDPEEDEPGPPELEEGPTPMPPMPPEVVSPSPPTPIPPSFVPPDPVGSLRGLLAEQATKPNEDRTEAVRRRLAYFTKPGSAGKDEVSSGC